MACSWYYVKNGFIATSIYVHRVISMADYEKLYHLLFNAVTDALEQLEARNYGEAGETLRAAQEEAEEMYMETE